MAAEQLECASKSCYFLCHRNPPPHFSIDDRKFCCSLCRLSVGKEHGGHCGKKISPVNAQKATYTEAFPSSWSDTPKKRRVWEQLQRNERFLDNQETSTGDLKCRYCQKSPLRRAHWSEHYDGTDLATVDHVVARANEGTDHPSNLVVACRDCNLKKANK